MVRQVRRDTSYLLILQKATSLTKSQREGLASLKKRSKEGDLFILERDKTNKFAAVDQDTYLKMGEKHTHKDEVISQREAELSLIHISEPTRLGMISYAVFCLKKKILSRRERMAECRVHNLELVTDQF